MRCAALLIALPSALSPAVAQDVLNGQTLTPSIGQSAQIADSSVGQVGQRQAREEAAPNVEPMGRINNRVANRVQSRIRNRIDRFYDPQANAASPFEVAGEQARAAGRRTRR